MSEEIKEGDEVRLVTGGPVMRVKEIQNDFASCEWLVVDKRVTMNFKIRYLVREAPDGLADDEEI